MAAVHLAHLEEESPKREEEDEPGDPDGISGVTEEIYGAPGMGNVIVWVQVDRVLGYDKDQIALVIPDESRFAE